MRQRELAAVLRASRRASARRVGFSSPARASAMVAAWAAHPARHPEKCGRVLLQWSCEYNYFVSAPSTRCSAAAATARPRPCSTCSPAATSGEQRLDRGHRLGSAAGYGAWPRRRVRAHDAPQARRRVVPDARAVPRAHVADRLVRRMALSRFLCAPAALSGSSLFAFDGVALGQHLCSSSGGGDGNGGGAASCRRVLRPRRIRHARLALRLQRDGLRVAGRAAEPTFVQWVGDGASAAAGPPSRRAAAGRVWATWPAPCLRALPRRGSAAAPRPEEAKSKPWPCASYRCGLARWLFSKPSSIENYSRGNRCMPASLLMPPWHNDVDRDEPFHASTVPCARRGYEDADQLLRTAAGMSSPRSAARGLHRRSRGAQMMPAARVLGQVDLLA